MKTTPVEPQETRTPCFDFLSMSDTRQDHENEHLMHELGVQLGRGIVTRPFCTGNRIR
jgi:hypothetical protein